MIKGDKKRDGWGRYPKFYLLILYINYDQQMYMHGCYIIFVSVLKKRDDAVCIDAHAFFIYWRFFCFSAALCLFAADSLSAGTDAPSFAASCWDAV
jgi:hypothetical protein